MLPSGWTQATIDNLIGSRGVFRDGDWVESKDQDPDGDVRLIQLADIGEGNFRDKSSRFLTSEKSVELNCTFLEQGDVLVARMPDPLGRACLFPLHGYKEFVTVVDVCVIRFGHSLVDGKYFTYILNSPASRKKISDHQTGSTRKRISRGNLSKLQFPIAPLNEQHRIVAKIEELFSELDAGIESLKTAQAQLKVYRQSLLKQAFEGKLTAQWREQNKDKLESAGALLARIQTERANRYQQQLKEWEAAGKPGSKPKAPKPLPPLTAEELAELPELPEGWGWVRLAHIQSSDKFAVKAGPFGSALKKEYYVPEGYKIYGQEQVIRGDHVYGDYFVNQTKYEELISCAVKPFDILISLVGTIGKVLVLPENIKLGIINPRLVKISLNLEFYKAEFFKAYFESGFLRSLYSQESQGTTMDILNLGIIQSLPYPLCSKSEQEQILLELDSKFSMINQMENIIAESTQKSEALRQSILKKAFSGQLVPQDPNDEPASALLARIKAEKAALPKSRKVSA